VNTPRFLYDGFFPGYYGTAPKVLFIGREARNQESQNYIANAIEHFERYPKVNAAHYWRRMIRMFNIARNHGAIDESIADDTIVAMVEKADYGFAAMDISKYINDSEDSSSFDVVLANSFFSDSDLGHTHRNCSNRNG